MDKIINMNDHLHKKDLDLILEVNKKAIEVEMAVADQNEELIGSQNDIKENQEKIIEIVKEINNGIREQDKEIYKLQILYVMGFLTLIAQIIQIFLKK
jgi:hypothetical protein